MTRMQAVRIHDYGSIDALHYEEVARPVVGTDQVLVRVRAAGVNPLDWKVRSGINKLWHPFTFPIILGFDAAGVIEAVGTGVMDFAVGDEVYGTSDFGGYAEYVSVYAGDIAHKPRSLTFVEAASMPIAAITVWESLVDNAHLDAGQTVLIHGAAGGVGHLAVQLAKGLGARVIATGSAHSLEFLRQLGADEVIDYSSVRFETVAQNVDVVLDCVGGETLERSWRVVRPGGTLLALTYPGESGTVETRGIRYCKVNLQHSRRRTLDAAARLADAGQVRPYVSHVFPLQEAHRAHELIEARHVRGKIVLQV